MDSWDDDVTLPMQSTTYFRSDDGNSSTSRNIGMRYGQNIQMSGPATALRSNSNNEFVFNLPQVHAATSEPENEKALQQWNKLFAMCWLFAIFLDPLFFFLLSVNPDNKCIMLNGIMATTAIVLRSTIDFIFLLRMLLKVKFWLAYVAPENRVVTGAMHYFFSYFFIIDFFAVLPLPQIILLVIFSKGVSSARNLLQYAILVQYLPRLSWVLPLFKQTRSLTGLIFKSALGYFVSNMLAYVFLGHIIGSLWYSFGLQRVNDCFIDASCRRNNIMNCKKLIDCGGRGGGGDDSSSRLLWKNNENVTACLGQGSNFDFGIYQKTVNLTTHASLPLRYVYSLCWGFQQLSNLAGNLVPSYSMGEAVFTTFITVGGLVLLGCFIANMHNFLQALGRRTLRRHDFEQWMRHHRLPEELRSHVRDAERFNWAATTSRSVVNKEMLMENLPEDLQKGIRRHLFKGVRKVRILEVLDEPIVDAICERLKTKTYVKGSKILYPSSLMDKMVFIIRGKMESIGEDRIPVPLAEGDVCGEELLTWCLEHSSVNTSTKLNSLIVAGHRLLSKRFVRCLTNVEALVLLAADLTEVTSLFSRFLRSPRVQSAIRYESPYWRGLAAKRIQVAWRHKIRQRIHKSPSSRD